MRRGLVAKGARAIAGRWARQAHAGGVDLGLDTGLLFTAIAGQREVEAAATNGTSLLAITEPTEIATAAAFAHTAVLAGRPWNAEPLAEAGRLFGRVAHLLDAIEDLEQDRRTGAWNPLTATGFGVEQARELARDAVWGVRLALSEADFADGRLVHKLLVHELEHAVARTAHASILYPAVEEPPRHRDLVTGCALAAWMCCTCQVCCGDFYPGPWSGKRREGWCNSCDCCDCCCCPCATEHFPLRSWAYERASQGLRQPADRDSHLAT